MPGCFSIVPRTARDARGSFVKTVHASTFSRAGLSCDFREQYFSVSAGGVLRGMHFQLPPFDHDKVVFCQTGRALDVILDLRAGSPWFGRTLSLTLEGDRASGVYVPRGCAHGFLSLVDGTILLYNVTSEHSPDHDSGVLWSSIPFSWPIEKPTVSGRDSAFPALHDFQSPFVFGK